jgi:ABC-type amino acid transport substrate-binding protein
MGVVDNFELAITTRPYYRSSWAFVYVQGRGLDDIKSQADLAGLPAERKAGLNIGSFDQGPGTDWLFKHGMVENIRPYQIMLGDARVNAGRILEQDLVAGDIDIMLVWGPIAGYYANKIAEEQGVGLAIVPFRDEDEIKFEYNISMAVRFGEGAWRDRLNGIIEGKQQEIAGLLAEYNFPILPIPEAALADRKDDDDDD